MCPENRLFNLNFKYKFVFTNKIRFFFARQVTIDISYIFQRAILEESLRRRPPVVDDELSVKADRILGGPRSKRVSEVDVMKAKRVRVAKVPFEVVHQRPGRIADNIAAVQSDGCKGLVHKVY